MIVLVSYDPADPESILKAEETKASVEKYDEWGGCSLVPMITREQLPNTKWIKNGKIHSHEIKVEEFPEEPEYYRNLLYQQRLAISHRLLWQRIIRVKQSAAIVEAGMLCYSNWTKTKFKDCLILEMEHAFDYPTPLERFWMHTPKDREIGAHPLDSTHPLKNTCDNAYHGADLIPAPVSYALNVRGANKLLQAIAKNGIDQVNHTINSKAIDLEFLYPSVFRYKTANLITDGTRLP